MSRLLSLALAIAVLAGCDDRGGGEARGGGSWPNPRTPAPDGRAVVWAVGDGADGGRVARRLARRIARGRPDLFLYLGDVYEGRTVAEYKRRYGRVYGRFARITAPTPGNHEWPSRRSGYDPYWARRTGGRPPAYYALSVEGWRVISLNSEIAHDRDSRQLRWLRRELRGRRGNCTIAFWHRPRYSVGRHGSQPDTGTFWQALSGRAVLVLGGHDHDSQRLRRRRGIVQLVAGAGGHGLYPLRRRSRALAFGDGRRYAALKMVLRRGSAAFAFVTGGGRRLDKGRVRCRPDPTSARSPTPH